MRFTRLINYRKLKVLGDLALSALIFITARLACTILLYTHGLLEEYQLICLPGDRDLLLVCANTYRVGAGVFRSRILSSRHNAERNFNFQGTFGTLPFPNFYDNFEKAALINQSTALAIPLKIEWSKMEGGGGTK